MSMTMSTPSRTSLHLHLACRDLQRSPRGSVTRCTAAKTPYNGFNVIPLLSVDVNAIELAINKSINAQVAANQLESQINAARPMRMTSLRSGRPLGDTVHSESRSHVSSTR